MVGNPLPGRVTDSGTLCHIIDMQCSSLIDGNAAVLLGFFTSLFGYRTSIAKQDFLFLNGTPCFAISSLHISRHCKLQHILRIPSKFETD